MRKEKSLIRLLSAVSVLAITITSCTKTDVGNPALSSSSTDDAIAKVHHIYGVLPPQASHFSKVKVYSALQIKGMFERSFSATAEPSSYTLQSPAVRDQEQLGSCTGFAGTEANEILRYYKNGTWPSVLSPLYLYYAERVKIEGYSLTSDPGAEMVDIPEALQKYGECIESDYVYPDNASHTAGPSSKAYKTAPGSAAISNALSYKIGATVSNYGMIAQGDTASVIALLLQNIPVVMGFNVYDNSSYTIFEGLNTTNYTYSPLTTTGKLKSGLSLLGGHANVIIGYDNTKKAFLMENSWSTGWGNKGYWYLPYSVFQSTKIVPTGNVYWMTL